MVISCKLDMLKLHQLAKSLAREAGKLVIEMRDSKINSNSQGLGIERKSSMVDLVTRADIASQNLIFNTLREVCPTHRLIGEEEDEGGEKPSGNGRILDDRPTWIVDAIDGTTNFVHDLVNYSVSIGFSVNKCIMMGAVYNPFTNEMFSAVRGYGSFLNDQRIKTSTCKSLLDAIVISEWSYERSEKGIDRMLNVNKNLLRYPVRGIRQLGSGSMDLCYVAMGRVQAVYGGVAWGDRWQIWDYAAGVVIAEEAGAIIKSIDGSSFDLHGGNIVCSTPAIMNDLVNTINC